MMNFGPIICPFCGCADVYELTSKKTTYSCYDCRKIFSMDYSVSDIENDIDDSFGKDRVRMNPYSSVTMQRIWKMRSSDPWQ